MPRWRGETKSRHRRRLPGPDSLHAEKHAVGVAVHGAISLDAECDMEVPGFMLRGEGWIEGGCAYPDGTLAAYVHGGAEPPKGHARPDDDSCWTEPEGLVLGQASSDAAGRIRITALKPGRYPSGSAEASWLEDDPHGPEVVVATGAREALVTCAYRRMIVRGVDASGTPARGEKPGSHGKGAHLEDTEEGILEGPDGHAAFWTEPGQAWEMSASTTPRAQVPPAPRAWGGPSERVGPHALGVEDGPPRVPWAIQGGGEGWAPPSRGRGPRSALRDPHAGPGGSPGPDASTSNRFAARPCRLP